MKKFRLVKTLAKDVITNLWFNNETKSYEIWRNHGLVEVLCYTNSELANEKIEDLAIEEAQAWLKDTENCNMTLNEYLQRNNIKLTLLEISVLEYILGEGSFYEESCERIKDEKTGEYIDTYVERSYGTFIGWEIYESEVPGCRGAISSLIRKGILTVIYQTIDKRKEQASYYLHFKPEFVEDGYYHQLKIDGNNLK